MKNIFTFLTASLLLCGYWNRASAQVPALDTANLPALGKTYVMYRAVPDSFNLNVAGSDSRWDFSKIKRLGTDSLVTQIMDAASQALGGDFPDASLAAVTANGNSFQFMSLNGDTMQSYGFAEGTGQQSIGIYSDGQALLKFPFKFTDDYYDNYEGNFTSASDEKFHRRGVMYVSADAYGTLVLPHDSFTRVLRILRQQDYEDSNKASGEMVYGAVKTYTYYLPGAFNPLLVIKEETILKGVSSTFNRTITYNEKVKRSNVAVKQVSKPFAEVVLYPNPSTGNASLRLHSAAAAQGLLTITDLAGRSILTMEVALQPGTNTIPFAVEAKGLVLVRLSTATGTVVEKLLLK